MNVFAANALLKILEEPPSHTIFILIAEQMSSIPATILSRCQKYIFPAPVCLSASYLSIGTFYPEESPRALLIKQSAAMVTALCDLVEKKTSVCAIAICWSTYVLDDMLWFLYLVTADVIQQQLVPNAPVPMHDALHQLSQRLSAVTLFNQLEKINQIMRKINRNIHFNQTLVLENVLLGYLNDQ